MLLYDSVHLNTSNKLVVFDSSHLSPLTDYAELKRVSWFTEIDLGHFWPR